VDAVRESELTSELERLRAEIDRREREAVAREEQLQRYAADVNETFKQEKARRHELQQSYITTIRALSNAVEARDRYTGKHAERVAEYGKVIAAAVPGLDLARSPEIEFGFLLHDVGKIAVPDAILYKEGRLTPQERLVMEQHPVSGAEIVAGIGFLGEAVSVIRHHHERFDGSGYPDRLAAEAIPLVARVFAVADVLDALTTDRPYRQASPMPIARQMILHESGRHFDPAVVAIYSGIPDATFERIGAEIR
jgi:ribonuclease P protein subunit RPR2